MERVGIFWLFAVVIALWLLIGLGAPLLLGTSAASTGEVGDQFGAVNALFSGLALACIVITLRDQAKQMHQQQESIDMQREELSLQREEMRLQREEMEQSRGEQKRSADAATYAAAISALTAEIADKRAGKEKSGLEYARARTHFTDAKSRGQTGDKMAEVKEFRDGKKQLYERVSEELGELEEELGGCVRSLRLLIQTMREPTSGNNPPSQPGKSVPAAGD